VNSNNLLAEWDNFVWTARESSPECAINGISRLSGIWDGLALMIAQIKWY